jgi:TPR repeat protein
VFPRVTCRTFPDKLPEVQWESESWFSHRVCKDQRSAARRGDPAAKDELAAMYESGFGVARNFSRAKRLYQDAADHGYGPAMVNLGLLYIEAVGVTRDDVQGYALVAAAVQIGIPDEMTRLAPDELREASASLDAQRLAEARLRARSPVANVASDAAL